MRFALVLALATFAHADDGLRRETIVVGQVIEREVGNAIGVACDDDVVTADMITRGDRNYVVVRGKREGKTLCRAGTDTTRASYLFELTVKPKRR